MRRYFQISPLSFDLDAPDGLPYPEDFLKFETAATDASFHYSLHIVDCLPEQSGTVLYQHSNLTVMAEGAGETRVIGMKGREENYAVYKEIDQTHADIFYQRDMLHLMPVNPVFVSLFALERRLNPMDCLTLHCAYTEYRDRAILFSAPSETGKTTQAGLWEQYRGARQVNGDKGLLQKTDVGWLVNGWPVCGTSKICYNETLPIQAIVMLRQAKENTVMRLSPMQAFMKMYSQLTVNSWNREQVSHASDLLEDLIAQIPVYELGCTISEEAVDVLDAALYGQP